MICLYLGCSSELPSDLVKNMVGHASFLIREGIGRWLSQHPSKYYLAHAITLASDQIPQVSVQGASARTAINKMIHG